MVWTGIAGGMDGVASPIDRMIGKIRHHALERHPLVESDILDHTPDQLPAQSFERFHLVSFLIIEDEGWLHLKEPWLQRRGAIIGHNSGSVAVAASPRLQLIRARQTMGLRPRRRSMEGPYDLCCNAIEVQVCNEFKSDDALRHGFTLVVNNDLLISG
jgi:hypothetical protein